ncbi:MAG: TRAP transporter small permease [Cohaesibacter sp.]|jgi:TRAP-type C4-dicarboxylate transport system permease small subunit|nr:TRAP transporter small permease [Cohaesibacter sp.]
MTSALSVAQLTRLIAIIGLTGIVGFSIITILDIIGRELFGVPIPGFSDILDLSIIFSATACFPASLLERHHVSVQFLGNIFPARAAGAALDFFGHVIALGVMGLIFWQVALHAVSVFETGEVTWLLGVKIWPVWFLVAAIFLVCVLVQMIVVGQLFGELLKGEQPGDKDGDDDPDAKDFKAASDHGIIGGGE